MHWFNVVTVFAVLLLAGVEFSVSAFVNPSAWRLSNEAQAVMLSHFAGVLGKLMPFWYAVDLLLLALQAFLNRHTPAISLLLGAVVIWALVIVATLAFLVPLNNRVVAAASGWQAAHRTWDKRHRVRILLLLIAAILLIDALVA